MSSSARTSTNAHLIADVDSDEAHIRYEFDTKKGVDFRSLNVDEDEVVMPPGAYQVTEIVKEMVGDKWCYTIRLSDPE